MALNKLAFFFFFSWTSGACFHCQEGEPGKELDLAKWLGEYWKGVGGPWPELKNGGGIIKSPTVWFTYLLSVRKGKRTCCPGNSMYFHHAGII